MKIFVILSLVLSVSVALADSTKKKHHKPNRAPNLSYVKIMDWRQFKKLSGEKKVQYLSIIQDFVATQEAKWPGNPRVALFDMDLSLFPSASAQTTSSTTTNPTLESQMAAAEAAAAAPAGASAGAPVAAPNAIDNTLPNCDAVKTVVKPDLERIAKAHNYCFIAGFQVCLSNVNGHLKCSMENEEYKNYAKSDEFKDNCTGGDNTHPCELPLFFDAKGKGFCVSTQDVKSQKPSPSVTQACKAHQDSLKLTKEQRAAILKKYDYGQDYGEMAKRIDEYCTKDIGRRWSFDEKDCKVLTDALAEVQPVADNFGPSKKPEEAKARCGGENEYVVGKSSVKFEFDQKNGNPPAYKLYMSSTSPDFDGFKIGKCDQYGRKLEDELSGYAEHVYEPCAWREKDGVFTTYQFSGDPTADGSEFCSVSRIEYKIGHLEDNQDNAKAKFGRGCYIDSFQPINSEKPFNFFVSPLNTQAYAKEPNYWNDMPVPSSLTKESHSWLIPLVSRVDEGPNTSWTGIQGKDFDATAMYHPGDPTPCWAKSEASIDPKSLPDPAVEAKVAQPPPVAH